MFKNVASQKLTVIAIADAGHATLDVGEPVTGDAAQITGQIAKDDGVPAASDDTNPTEPDATDLPGMYRFDLTQAETNCDKIEFAAKSSTAGVQVITLPSNVIYTRPPNFSAFGIESDGDVTKVNLCDTTTTVSNKVTLVNNAITAGTVAESFWDEMPGVYIRTTIATLASQTSFTLTAGSSDDNAYPVGSMVKIRNDGDVQQRCCGTLSAYTGGTMTVTLAADPGIFTMGVGDIVEILTVPSQVETVLAKLAGITLLADWLGALAGSTADAGTQTEIQATTAGAGYVITTDSQQAIRDNQGSVSLSAENITDIAEGVVSELGGASVTITSSVASDGTTITIVRGDDYKTADSRGIVWTGTVADQWPDLTGAALEFRAVKKGGPALEVVPVVTTPTGTQVLTMQLTNTETNALASGEYLYDVQATLASGNVITLLRGKLIVEQTYTDP